MPHAPATSSRHSASTASRSSGRLSAYARFARRYPSLSPASCRTPRTTTPYSPSFDPTSSRSASVSWISPPAPGLVAARWPQDRGRQHVAPDDRPAARRGPGLRLLDHLADAHAAAGDVEIARDDAVHVLVPRRHLDDRDRAGAGRVVHPHELADARVVVVVDQIVAEQHRERLVADRLARAQHRVAEAERVLLPHADQPHHRRHALHRVRQPDVAAIAQRALELERVVEVLLDRVLAAAVDDHDVGDAGAHGLFDHELQRRDVDDGQHLFGDRLGRRKESRSEPGGRDDCFSHALRSGHDARTLPSRSDMAEHRPFPPSPRRLGLARRAGLTAASPQVVAAAAWVAAAIAMVATARAAAAALGAWIAAACDGRATLAPEGVASAVLGVAVPVLVAIAVAALIAQLAQTRTPWLPRRTIAGAPSLERGARPRVAIAARELACAIAIAGVALSWLWAMASRLARLPSLAASAALPAAAALIASFIAALAVAWVVIGAVDALARWAAVSGALHMTDAERRVDRGSPRRNPRWRARRASAARGSSAPDAVAAAIVVLLGDDAAIAIAWDARTRPVPVRLAVGRPRARPSSSASRGDIASRCIATSRWSTSSPARRVRCPSTAGRAWRRSWRACARKPQIVTRRGTAARTRPRASPPTSPSSASARPAPRRRPARVHRHGPRRAPPRPPRSRRPPR